MLALAIAGCSAREALPPLEPAAKLPPDRARVAAGARLAALGNCMGCHTAPGGKPYAGGRALKTPFGTIHGTNITPDPETGIGRWSQAAFARAMREGIDRRGRHLYPAFPYDYFTHLTDDDIAALYAFLMAREPVRQPNVANAIPIPRFAVAVWNKRYLRPGPIEPDAAQSAEWNRGAYLVRGLAHCGACHTPRDKLGGEKKEEDFGGGEAEGWHAPALNATSPSPVPWTRDDLHTYLRTGIADSHALTAGPMVDVVHDLRGVPDEDVRAIATYIASLDRRSDEERRKAAEEAAANVSREADDHQKGKAIYAGACGQCHDRGRQAEGGALQLPLATGLTIPTSRNLAYIIRQGIEPQDGERGAWM
ncbi:MAG TPA: cytochrome c, partial [Burkholderiales bacterium]|nr:cytochrome c [Burkholderiales bacterium]